MVFHRSRRKINNGNILLDTTILSQVTFTKFLGVILDDKLKWTHHISYIKNKISKGMGIILKARKVLKKKVLLQLYHSFVTPYLVYCLGNASAIHLQPLITTTTKMLELLLFRHTALIQIFYLNISMSFPSKKLLFLRIGLQMFRYTYGQLPDALNMFLLRINLCIITVLETRTNSALLLLSIYTGTETFDLLVSMFGIIYVTI